MSISATNQGLRPGVCLSTARPTTPFDGQVIYETDTDLVRAWNGSSWVTVGPTSVVVTAADSAKIDTDQSTTSTTYTDLTTVGPTVTLITGTKVIVALSCYTGPTGAGATGAMGFAVSGATTISAQDNNAAGLWGWSASGGSGVISWVGMVTLTAGSNTFTAKYKRGSAASHNFGYRNLTVWAL